MTSASPQASSPVSAGTVIALESRHLDEVVEIHLSSWSAEEVSVILGESFVRRFYQTLIQSPAAFGYAYTLNQHVVAYATGFWDYEQFVADLIRGRRLRFGCLILARILAGRLRLQDTVSLLLDQRGYRQLTYPDYHQNGLALRNEYKHTPLGRLAMTEVIHTVLQTFRDAGVPGCWGRTDARNLPMRAYYTTLGFTEAASHQGRGSRYVVFEKVLS